MDNNPDFDPGYIPRINPGEFFAAHDDAESIDSDEEQMRAAELEIATKPSKSQKKKMKQRRKKKREDEELLDLMDDEGLEGAVSSLPHPTHIHPTRVRRSV
jgi:hypothetical protein